MVTIEKSLETKQYREIFNKEYICRTKAEDLDLIFKIRNGDDNAREKLILKYIHKVESQAKKCFFSNGSLSFDDLVQEGWIGVMKAIDKFDETKNVPFNYYVGQWIFAYMQIHIYKNNANIRTPTLVIQKLSKIEAFIKDKISTTGKKPEIKEISKELNIPKGTIKNILKHKIVQITMDNTVKNDENKDMTLKESLPGNVKNPEEIQIFSDDFNLVQSYMKSNLTEEERFILVEYFGLNGKFPSTLEDIGQNLKNISKRKKSMCKMGVLLKKKRILKKLKVFLDKN